MAERSKSRKGNVAYIAPSLLAADFSRLADEVKKAVSAGADFIHCDVMDGHFVPNISFGAIVVEAVKKYAGKVPVEAHLMIDEPARYVKDFINTGADVITVHCESPEDPARAMEEIRRAGRMVGVAINPPTPLERAEKLLAMKPELVLCMTVNPGFGGQKFIEDVLPKIAAVRKAYNPKYLAVDGGINPDTIRLAAKAGANFIVAGTAVFRAKDPSSAVRELRAAAGENNG